MRCSSCGSENREGRKFCAPCGVVEETGAKTYESFVYVERADLARLTATKPSTSGSFASSSGVSRNRCADPRGGSREGTRAGDYLVRRIPHVRRLGIADSHVCKPGAQRNSSANW